MNKKGDSLKQWFSTGSSVLLRRTFGNVCSHFSLSGLQDVGGRIVPVVLWIEATDAVNMLHNAQDKPPQERIIGPKIIRDLRLKNPGVER